MEEMDLPVKKTGALKKKRQQSFNKKVVYLVESLLVYLQGKSNSPCTQPNCC